MLWLWVTLSAVFINALGKIIHRYILKDEDAIGYAFIWSFLSAVFYIPLLAIEPLRLPTTQLEWMGFFLAVALWLIINIVGFYSIKHTEITLRTPLNTIKIVLILLLGAVFLHEEITTWKVFGTLLVFAGAFVITWKKGALGHLTEYGVKLTLLTSLLTACVAIVDKFNMNNGISPAFYGMMMYLVPSLFLGIMTRSRIAGFRKLWENKAPFVILAALCYTGMYYLHMVAYTLGDVTNVYPVLQLTTLVTVILGYVLLKEKTEIKQRIVGAILMIMGAVLIALGA